MSVLRPCRAAVTSREPKLTFRAALPVGLRGSGPVLVLAGQRHRSVVDLAGRAEARPAT